MSNEKHLARIAAKIKQIPTVDMENEDVADFVYLHRLASDLLVDIADLKKQIDEMNNDRSNDPHGE